MTCSDIFLVFFMLFCALCCDLLSALALHAPHISSKIKIPVDVLGWLIGSDPPDMPACIPEESAFPFLPPLEQNSRL